MFFTLEKVYFYKNFEVFFFFIIYNFYLFFFFKKNFFFFFKFYINKINVIFSIFTKYILFLNSIFLFNYNYYQFFLSLFFLDFWLDGLYYRVKYYKNYNILGFILGFNHYILYKLPKKIKVCVHMKKRRFFLYSFDLLLLNNIGLELVNLKYPNLFKGKGLKINFMSYRKKILVKKQK